MIRYKGEYIAMKRTISLFLVISLFLSLLTCVMTSASFLSAAEGSENARTYYYDRLSDRQKKCYDYLKKYYDDLPSKPKGYSEELSSWLPSGFSFEEAKKLGEDFIIADMALVADEPMYSWKGRVSGYAQSSPGETPYFYVNILRTPLLTEEVEAHANARIRQIVAAVGSGDRYTKLRKLAHYLISNSFYDSFSDTLNSTGKDSLDTRGIYYDSDAYGLLTKNVAVCAGFADAVKVLCDELDIPCIQIGNKAHAWNLVQMEDGQWYRLDITNACRIGPDGRLPNTIDEYFRSVFLNNDTFGSFFYSDPYMLSLDGVAHVTEFPKLADGQYRYNGSTKDFSYTVPKLDHTPGEGKFSYKVNDDNKSCTITNYEGKQSGDLTVPESIDGFTVTAIDAYAFYYCTGFTGKLTLPDTVESIGYAAFAGCSGLTDIEFSNGLRKIGQGAFVGCTGLRELVLPDLLNEISENAFFGCASLSSVTFGRHVQSIGSDAFAKREGTTLQNKPLTFKAPDNSYVKEYASSNNIAFAVHGSSCDFRDTDGKWEYVSGDLHFHTCEHGAYFDYTRHADKNGSLSCGDKCEDCGAIYCAAMGFSNIPPKVVNDRPATCTSPGFTGETVCVCGNVLEEGKEISPTPHKPKDNTWKIRGEYHYQLCVCGEEVNKEKHSGGTASENERAVCSICGAHYGDLPSSGSSTKPSVTTEGGAAADTSTLESTVAGTSESGCAGAIGMNGSFVLLLLLCGYTASRKEKQ